MANFREFLKSVRAGGHLAFTMQEALASLKVSPNAVKCAIYKLRKKGEIISPAKNFFVIVPPEYQALGCLPADELLPLLMKHWSLDYYVCLLSAAMYCGASHQKPQVFQVMVNKQLKTRVHGQIKIEFIYKKSLQDLPLAKIPVKTGYLDISSPELTAMDLLLYSRHAGGLNHVATVLSELIESIDPEKMLLLIRSSEKKYWVQRLGYIIEHIETMEPDKQKKLAQLIYKYVSQLPMTFTPLASELEIKGSPRDQRWMIIENTTIESDL